MFGQLTHHSLIPVLCCFYKHVRMGRSVVIHIDEMMLRSAHVLSAHNDLSLFHFPVDFLVAPAFAPGLPYNHS